MNTKFEFQNHQYLNHSEDVRLQISQRAQTGLENMLQQLRTGRLGLWQLPFEVRAFYMVGFAEAESVYKPQLEQLQHEADTYYELWANPGRKFREMKQRRMEQAMQDAWDGRHVFTEAEQLVAMVEAALPQRGAA